MNENEVTLSAAGLTTLLVQFIKWAVRKIKKDPEYNLPGIFYIVGVPVSNALMPFLLFLLGVATNDPVLFMTWQQVLSYVIRIALGSLVSLVAYSGGVKPLNDYRKSLKQLP